MKKARILIISPHPLANKISPLFKYLNKKIKTIAHHKHLDASCLQKGRTSNNGSGEMNKELSDEHTWLLDRWWLSGVHELRLVSILLPIVSLRGIPASHVKHSCKTMGN